MMIVLVKCYPKALLANPEIRIKDIRSNKLVVKLPDPEPPNWRKKIIDDLHAQGIMVKSFVLNPELPPGFPDDDKEDWQQ